MTTDRQTLRAKHQPDENGYCKICANRNFDESTSVREWPCDVIKILDATEPDPDCDHSIGKVLVLAKGVTLNQADVKYCPKCGEKL